MAGKDFCRLFDKRGMTRHEAKPQHVTSKRKRRHDNKKTNDINEEKVNHFDR
jgi:hypothetical protein